VRAARELFAERGYAATAMVPIAARATVVRATVYNDFADKIDSLATIIRRYMHGYVEIGQRLRDDAVKGLTFTR
jgi:AcrR family transcriptional regulator